MQGQIDMNPAAVRSLGQLSDDAADPAQQAVSSLSGGWSPRSDPEFKSTLQLCRQEWIFTFIDVRDAARTIGDKLRASANAVSSSDTASADQF